MITIEFPITQKPHLATVKDKERNSGLTSVRFIDESTLVACDFNEHKMYLCKLSGADLEVIDSHSTVISDGSSVETDLMDFSDGIAVVSNFYQGSVSLYDIKGESIRFIEEIDLAPKYKNMHGVRFIPNYENLLWVTFCGKDNKCHQIWDVNKKEIIHEFETSEQCQDVGFLEDKAVVFARTDHIWTTKKPRIFSRKRKMYATAYVYQMPNDLRIAPPTLKATWKGKGHIDAVKEQDGYLFAANQYLNRVDVFTVDDRFQLKLKESLSGYGMPHGLDIVNGSLAVTNYEDQSLRICEV